MAPWLSIPRPMWRASGAIDMPRCHTKRSSNGLVVFRPVLLVAEGKPEASPQARSVQGNAGRCGGSFYAPT